VLVVVLAVVPPVPPVPPDGFVVVVVVVGVPNGGLDAGRVWLGGLAGVGVCTSALIGLAAM